MDICSGSLLANICTYKHILCMYEYVCIIDICIMAHINMQTITDGLFAHKNIFLFPDSQRQIYRFNADNELICIRFILISYKYAVPDWQTLELYHSNVLDIVIIVLRLLLCYKRLYNAFFYVRKNAKVSTLFFLHKLVCNLKWTYSRVHNIIVFRNGTGRGREFSSFIIYIIVFNLFLLWDSH